MEKDLFDEMANAWGKPVIPRPKLSEATCHTLTPKTAANLDSLGQGPPGRIIINGVTAYPTREFFDWLRARSKKAQ